MPWSTISMKAYGAGFVILFCLAFVEQSVSAEENQQWYYTSFDEAKAMADKTERPLFIYIHKPACGRCISTWNGITNDPALKKRIKEEVVFVFVDTETSRDDFQKAYSSIRTKGGSFGTPLIGIIGNKGKVLVDNEGYASVAQLNKFLDKIK